MKKNKGFTLIELLVVIAIIGIIAIVALPALFKNIEKAKVADLEADIITIKSAVRNIYTETGIDRYDVTLQKNSNGEVNLGILKTEEGEMLLEEIESLQIPFGGCYNLRTDRGNGAVEQGSFGDLILWIIPQTAISDEGIEKLERDLGQSVIRYYPDSNDMVGVVVFERE